MTSAPTDRPNHRPLGRPSGPGVEAGSPVSPVQGLLATLDLEGESEDVYLGRSPKVGWQRVFGGQVVAQALVAAARTVPDDRAVHSLHSYFLRPGDPAVPIRYEVERIRDGRSFTTRRVVAEQHGAAIFSMSASFQIRNQHGPRHQSTMPDVPGPDDLPGEAAFAAIVAEHASEPVRRYWSRPRPIEFRPVDLEGYLDRRGFEAPGETRQNVWFRLRETVDGPPALHAALLAYISDTTLLDTALLTTGRSIFDPDIQVASIDHALWFHDDARVDEWLLYTQDSPFAGGARGFSRGAIYRTDGTLLASVAQEGLTRIVTPREN